MILHEGSQELLLVVRCLLLRMQTVAQAVQTRQNRARISTKN